MKLLSNQVIRYIVVGGLATLIDYGGMFLLYYTFHWNYLLANTLSFTASVVFNYWASMRYVFESRYDESEKHKEFITFVGLNLVGLLLSSLLLKLGVDGLGMAVWLTKLLTGIFTTIFNFVAKKLLLEKRD